MLLYVCKSFSILGGKMPFISKKMLRLENSNDTKNNNPSVHLPMTKRALSHWNEPGTL